MTAHPATYSDRILDTIAGLLEKHQDNIDSRLGEFAPKIRTILDPFAGTGGIHRLHERGGWVTYGVELEPEWAHQTEAATFVGSALDLSKMPEVFPVDAIVTSPCYGNRMADHHEAQDHSRRHTYRHYLGRPLSPASAAVLQWGEAYRVFHRRAWAEATRVVRQDGYGVFVLNIKDHIRKGEHQQVREWHLQALGDLGWTLQDARIVEAPGQRHGANGGVRLDYEHVDLFRLEVPW